MLIRTLTEKDIPQLKKIWKDTFDDPMYFIDWYFDNRFFPDHSACACEGEEIICVCHTMPTRINIRGKVIPCALLNGVATLPQYRGRGLMKQVITYLYELLVPMGFCLMPNTPAALEIYAPCGHYPNTSMAELNRAEQHTMPKGVTFGEIKEHTDTLFGIYQQIASAYSGMILRTEEEFHRKCDEYILDDCRVILSEKGYAVYFDSETACTCAEFIAGDPDDIRLLRDALFSHAYPRPLKGRFPVEAFPREKVVPRSVLGILSAERFLKALDLSIPAVIRVRDDFYPKNSGTYLLNGTSTVQPPQIELSAAALGQWLSGYCTLEETDAVILDESIPRLPLERCFTNDDY